ncbi:MAG: DUF3169 family protein [Lachnospiraceae bacterium]|nr:DUF3169 family protein [Lachnospiraceae bacterium]
MSRDNFNELTEKQQENKKEDKKALVRFILILVVAFVAGIGIGIGGVLFRHVLGDETIKNAILKVLRYIAIYGGYIYTTVLLIAGIVLYKKSRRAYTAWDEEDEDVLCGIETKISYVIWFSNLIMYGSYFFFSVGIWATDIFNAGDSLKEQGISYKIAIGIVFLHIAYALITACIIQQKAVNLSKEINPEKTGSVYDMKFQDKWLANCDEAERFAAYKCSFKTFKTMQITGMVLWLICLVGQMTFDTGAFATIIVTIFMIIQTSVYSVQSIYFAKHPSEVMK